MRCATVLAIAGLVAAQSTTVVVTDGMTTTLVLPEWNTAEDGGQDIDTATATLIVPPEEETETVTEAETDTATETVTDIDTETETDTAEATETVTATDATTTLATVTTVPEETDAGETPPVVTTNAGASLGVESLGGLLAFVAAGVAML